MGGDLCHIVRHLLDAESLLRPLQTEIDIDGQILQRDFGQTDLVEGQGTHQGVENAAQLHIVHPEGAAEGLAVRGEVPYQAAALVELGPFGPDTVIGFALDLDMVVFQHGFHPLDDR